MASQLETLSTTENVENVHQPAGNSQESNPDGKCDLTSYIEGN